jgi:uncharacterized protein with gpF-like domain|tara:strand:- start:72 stop:386 length:315 start_codon:yes stop_codon:yes gene_type:complete
MTLKYDEHGHPYEDLSEFNKKLNNRIKELEKSLSIALEINDKFQRESAALIKNRPLDTMDEVAYRELRAENERLKKDLAQVREDSQHNSLVHAEELKRALKIWC